MEFEGEVGGYAGGWDGMGYCGYCSAERGGVLEVKSWKVKSSKGAARGWREMLKAGSGDWGLGNVVWRGVAGRKPCF